MLEGYLHNFVNYDQNDWYQLLPLAEYAYNNSKASAHKITSFFANNGFHPQGEWMKERDIRNPGATMYSHWMKKVQEKARTTLVQTREAIERYKFPTLWTIQSSGKTREPSIQTRYFTTLENSSRISRLVS